MVGIILLASLIASSIGVRVLLPLLKASGVVGEDAHKPGRPHTPEMGGLAILAGFGVGLLLAMASVSFFHTFPAVNTLALLAVLSTVLLAGLVGLVDDLLGMRQWAKAMIPVLAAVPLMAVRAGHTWMVIPFIGEIHLWIFYPLLVIPIGVAVAVNAVNMLAGFNGLELGLGVVAMASLSVIAGVRGEITALVILLAGGGALLGVVRSNWYPARVFVGDVGTLSIGAIIASAVIVGNMEVAGLILLIPYAVDFLIKAPNGFPKTFGELRDDGKLHCPPGPAKGLGQLIMKVAGGIHERPLVLLLMGVEAIFGLGAILLYLLR